MFLSDNQIERRCRRMLARCGLRMHKSRIDSEYKYSIRDDEGDGPPLRLMQLVDAAEALDLKRRIRCGR